MGHFRREEFLDGTFWLFKGDRSRYLAYFLFQILQHHEHLRTRFSHFLSHGRLLASAQHQRHLEWKLLPCGTDSSYQKAQTFIFPLVSSINFPHYICSSAHVGPSKATSARWLLFQAPCSRREKSTMKLRASASVRPRTRWRVSLSEIRSMTRTRFPRTIGEFHHAAIYRPVTVHFRFDLGPFGRLDPEHGWRPDRKSQQPQAKDRRFQPRIGQRRLPSNVIVIAVLPAPN